MTWLSLIDVESPLEKFGLFSDFQYGFRSTKDLLTVASDRIARAFLTGLGLLEL